MHIFVIVRLEAMKVTEEEERNFLCLEIVEMKGKGRGKKFNNFSPIFFSSHFHSHFSSKFQTKCEENVVFDFFFRVSRKLG